MRTYSQFLVFCVIGCINTMLSIGSFWLLHHVFGVNYLGASVLAYSTGAANSFLMNKRWTFQARNKLTDELIKFLMLNLSGLALNAVLMVLAVSLLGLFPLLAQCLVVGIITVFNFLGQKLYVF